MARGSLGTVVSSDRMFRVQKYVLAKCNALAKVRRIKSLSDIGVCVGVCETSRKAHLRVLPSGLPACETPWV